MIEKRSPYRNKKILNAAKGEDCTINSPVCNYNPETTVGAHPNESWAGKGGSQKADDIPVFACSDCHDWLDGRTHIEGLAEEDKWWYWFRGLYRTIRRLLDLGVLK